MHLWRGIFNIIFFISFVIVIFINYRSIIETVRDKFLFARYKVFWFMFLLVIVDLVNTCVTVRPVRIPAPDRSVGRAPD